MEPASPLPHPKLHENHGLVAGLPLPLRGGPKAEGRALASLVSALRQAGVRDARLLGFVSQPGGAAIQQAHLLVGLAGMLLSLIWPAGGLGLLLLLTSSALSRSLGGPGFKLAMGRPAWNLMIQPDKRRADRLVVVALDRRRVMPMLEKVSAGCLGFSCLIPAFPNLFPEVGLMMLLLVVGLGWASRPYPLESEGPEKRGLEQLLQLSFQLPPRTWLLATSAGSEGLQSVLDWWNLQGKIEIFQIGGETLLHPLARRFEAEREDVRGVS